MRACYRRWSESPRPAAGAAARVLCTCWSIARSLAYSCHSSCKVTPASFSSLPVRAWPGTGCDLQRGIAARYRRASSSASRHSGTASASTRSRRAGCRLASVTTSTRQLLGVDQQPTQSQRADTRSQRHERVDVAFVAGVATAHRAKHPITGHTPSPSEVELFVAVGSDQRMHAGESSQSHDA